MPKWTSDWKSDMIHIQQMLHNPADYLFAASLLGFYELLELRLRSKPDPLFVRSATVKHNALQLTCSRGNRDVTKFLLDRGWGLQVENNYTLLGLALDGSHFETVKLLLSRGVDPNEKSRFSYPAGLVFPMFRASRSGSLKLVKILLDYRASADIEDVSGLKPFHAAAIEGKQEIAEILLAACTDADEFPRSFCRQLFLVHKATEDGYEDPLNSALEEWPQGAQFNKYLDYALWNAMRRTKYTMFNETCVEALLAKGADANCSFHGVSLVGIVARRGRKGDRRTMLSARDFSIMQLLTDHGADLGKREFMLGPEVESD